MKRHVKLFEQFSSPAGHSSIDSLWCTYYYEDFVFNPVALYATQEEAGAHEEEMWNDRYGDEIYMKAEEWFLNNLAHYRKNFGVRTMDQLEKKAPEEMKRLMDEAYIEVTDDVGFDIQWGSEKVSELTDKERDAVIQALEAGEIQLPGTSREHL